MNAAAPTRSLEDLQRWMQAVISHPAGIERGIRSEGAREHIEVEPEEVDRIVLPSHRLSSLERLRIYGNAYYARLLECLREEFPALRHAVGEEAFDGFALGYLQRHPSQSYTLGELARHFPEFLSQTRPPEPADELRPNWADFVIDLATAERVYSEVFDGPGVEQGRVLQAEDVASLTAGQWLEARLIPVPCLRLLKVAYPVHEYISALRRQAPIPIPAPQPTHLAITRRDYVVRRRAVSPEEFGLLALLADGAAVGDAIERVANSAGDDLEALAGKLHEWFQGWALAGYFERVELPR